MGGKARFFLGYLPIVLSFVSAEGVVPIGENSLTCGNRLADNSLPATLIGVITPLRASTGLQSPRIEKAIAVKTARVILADYDLLKRDFPTLRSKTHSELDQWLLDKAGFIALPQASQIVTNSPVQTNETTIPAFRPKDYGRGLVFRAESGLIDAKGAGALHPTNEEHSNGLATLEETIREFLYSKLVRAVFEHSNSSFRVVDSYAVFDLGFDTLFMGRQGSPAGMVLRQAHTRAKGDKSSLGKGRSARIESLLRRYGLTAAGSYGEGPYDLINIQGTANGDMVDFGSMLALSRFKKDAYHFDYSPDQSDKYTPLLSTNRVDFPQPDPAVQIPPEQWGYSDSGRRDSLFDNPTIWSRHLANALREGRAAREHVTAHMKNFFDPVRKKWQDRTPPFLIRLLEELP